MKTFVEFLEEGVDPLEKKLSGGRGDNPDLAGITPVNDHHQITDHLKPQNTHVVDYLKKIKPHVQMTHKQNSKNISANDGEKNTRHK